MLAISTLSFCALAQKTAVIRVNEVLVKINGLQETGGPVSIPVEVNDRSAAQTLFSNGELVIKASYKLADLKSNRSDNKAAGIRFRITYTCTYKGKKTERKVERFFFLNDERKFEEKDVFVFSSGINNTKVELRYTGQLEN